MRTRPSARLLVVNRERHLLLFHFVHREGPLAGESYWATPGGALEGRESFVEAARRELREETGIVAEVGAEVAGRQAAFPLPDGETVQADERYFLVRAADDTVNTDGFDALEAEIIARHRWWRLEDLATTTETVFPEDLATMVRDALAGRQRFREAVEGGESTGDAEFRSGR